MTDSFALKYYSNMLLQIKRGFRNDTVVNAKLYLLLAIFDLIESNVIRDNKIFYTYDLTDLYDNYHSQQERNFKTPLFRPFYYLSSDGFWHIEWKDKSKAIRISDSFLRKNVDYAHLDNALWDLLQDKQNRNALRQNIINFYFKK